MSGPEDVFSVKEFGQRVAEGKAAYQAGRFADAIRAWKAAQAVDPSRRGELEGYLGKAIAKQAAIQLQHAKRLEAKGDHDEALAQYRQVMALGLRDPALKEQVADRIRSYEEKTAAMSRTMFVSIAAAYALIVAVLLWLILFRLD